MSGQHHVSYNDASRHHAACVKCRLARNLRHLPDRLRRHIEIVRHMCVPVCDILSTELEVRQKDIHRSFQHMHGLRRLDRTGIVDNGDMKSLRTGQPHRLYDLRNIVGGSDQIDVIGLRLLQFKKYFPQPGCRYLLSCFCSHTSGGDVPILTEHTAERTADEKDCP